MSSRPGERLGGEIAFAQVREDPEVERAVVAEVARRSGRPARVLLVASGGCTALSLAAAAEVQAIDAIDVSQAQLDLCALKLEAWRSLDSPALRVLLGDGGDPEARAGLYAGLRDRLPPAARARFDARPHEIAAGLNKIGRFEALFAELRAALAGAGVPLDHRGPAHPAFREVFARVFERESLRLRFGDAAVDYSMDRSFADHFAARFADALGRYRPGENLYLDEVLRGRYPPGDGPPYLARRPGPRPIAIGLHLGSFADHLARLGPFDVVHTSNVTDWMPLPAADRLFLAIRDHLAPGGAVIARRLNGDHRLAERVARHLRVDEAECAALAAGERAFFYSEVVVGWS